ncbi:hypothetical protein RRG08_033493 [Elysia crispata]|uniref:Uncharacterized protein n=1 Tax=Elysia crispata TaxID=231223 RepID=A0AAE1AVZ7_9GAST|nr:hypothetical protein RRG08_033493 [Elysia crispata]
MTSLRFDSNAENAEAAQESGAPVEEGRKVSEGAPAPFGALKPIRSLDWKLSPAGRGAVIRLSPDSTAFSVYPCGVNTSRSPPCTR